MKNFNINTTNNDEWLTPPEIIKSLGRFDLDPCSPINRPWNTANYHFDKRINGLNQKWFGRIWLNPPYGKEVFKWMEKLSIHCSGLALIFARTETKGFHEFIWNRANSIFFFKGRLSFYKINGEKGNVANAPSCLVSYSECDTLAIQNSKLNVRLVYL